MKLRADGLVEDGGKVAALSTVRYKPRMGLRIEASVMPKDFECESVLGLVRGKAGDFVIRTRRGWYVMPRSVFLELFAYDKGLVR